jgi:hypothetical protein
MDKETTTSEEILRYLIVDRCFDLTKEDKKIIRETIYDALQSAAEWQSNGCDCGQVACPICGG